MIKSTFRHPNTFVKVVGERVSGPEVFISQEQELTHLNELINSKQPSVLRVMTFNIHHFEDRVDESKEDPVDRSNEDRVYNIVEQIDADVLVFQEMPHTLSRPECDRYDARMKALGYPHVVRCFAEAYYEIGNVLYSKFPLTNTASHTLAPGGRCYVSGIIQTPKGNVRITGTHLEESSESRRLRQIKEILYFVQTDPDTQHHIILGDFNEWKMKGLFRLTREAGLVNAFDALQWERPQYTCWTGTAVDYVLVQKSLVDYVSGAFVYHTPASDHLPIVVDLKLCE